MNEQYQNPESWRVGRGWWGLVQPLVKLANAKNLEIFQIKEKFGGLRFYAARDEELEKAIRAAEDDSLITCEECGARGYLGGEGWVKTHCIPCHRYFAALRALTPIELGDTLETTRERYRAWHEKHLARVQEANDG